MWGDYMVLIEAIREAIAAFWDTVEQTDIVYATYTGEGLKIDNTSIDILMDKVDIPKVLSQQGVELEYQTDSGKAGKTVLKQPLKAGDKVAVAVHHGGKRYSILYKI